MTLFETFIQHWLTFFDEQSWTSHLNHTLSRYDALEARQTSKPHNRRALFDVELYLTMYKSFVSTSLNTISLSHDDEYPPFLGGIQFSLTNADN
jgi:hypothetical protein